jgi:hypothetical protein
VVDHLSKGKSLASFAAKLGVSLETVKRWRRQKPEFEAACLLAKDKNQQWFEEIMMAHITGSYKSERLNTEGKYLRFSNSQMLRWAMARRFPDYADASTASTKADEDKEVIYKSYIDESGMIRTEKEERSL